MRWGIPVRSRIILQRFQLLHANSCLPTTSGQPTPDFVTVIVVLSISHTLRKSCSRSAVWWPLPLNYTNDTVSPFALRIPSSRHDIFWIQQLPRLNSNDQNNIYNDIINFVNPTNYTILSYSPRSSDSESVIHALQLLHPHLESCRRGSNLKF